jgi:hypothetical protein
VIAKIFHYNILIVQDTEQKQIMLTKTYIGKQYFDSARHRPKTNHIDQNIHWQKKIEQSEI